jgi:hypothetical protein
MIRRFADRKDCSTLVDQAREFTPRVYGPKTWFIITSCLISACVIGIFVSDLTYQHTDLSQGLLAILSIILVVYIVMCFKRINTRIALIEFQSLLFASASRANTRFCLLIHKDHRVIYCDSRYFDLFAQKYVLNLEQFVKEGWLDENSAQQLYAALESGTEATVNMARVAPDGSIESGPAVAARLTPLDRPRGYFVFKAAE